MMITLTVKKFTMVNAYLIHRLNGVNFLENKLFKKPKNYLQKVILKLMQKNDLT